VVNEGGGHTPAFVYQDVLIAYRVLLSRLNHQRAAIISAASVRRASTII